MVGRRPSGGRDRLSHGPQHQDGRGRPVDREGRGRRDRRVPGRDQDRLRIRGLTPRADRVIGGRAPPPPLQPTPPPPPPPLAARSPQDSSPATGSGPSLPFARPQAP